MAGGTKSALRVYLERLARARPNDAVKLVFFNDEDAGKIGRLDLSLVSEVKRSGSGATEVKLVDKTAVLAALAELEKQEKLQKTQGSNFYEALERASAAADVAGGTTAGYGGAAACVQAAEAGGTAASVRAISGERGEASGDGV